MNNTVYSHSQTVTRSCDSTPCRLYAQGYCRFEDKCKFSHSSALDMQAAKAASNLHSDHSQPQCQQFLASAVDSMSDVNGCTCGTCTKGARCWFRHDIDKSGIESSGSHELKQQVSETSCPILHPTGRDPSNSFLADITNVLETDSVRAQETRTRVARERADAIAREEAAKTLSQVISGSIVIFSAGLNVDNVDNLITGFETCTLRVGNLPCHVKDQDVRALIEDQGVDVDRVYFAIRKKWNSKREVLMVTDIVTGRALASSLDGIKFQEEALAVEMSSAHALEGMSIGTGRCSELLGISWLAPSVCYVAEYVDIAAARSMVEALHCLPYAGRRIKVEMNAQPRGHYVHNLPLNAIKISNLPPSVNDGDITGLTGSTSVKRLHTNDSSDTYSAEQIACQVRQSIEQAVPGGLRRLKGPTCSPEGRVSMSAHFSSWDDAHAASMCLSDKHFGNQTVQLRLPDSMYFTLVISAEQFKAQQAQWDSLSGSTKGTSACSLTIYKAGNVVLVRLSGSAKKEMGALKVRVENLARGAKVEGWHRSLGIPGNPFICQVLSKTGAYLRVDGKKKLLKVYGTSRAIDRARGVVKDELERLASVDYTITLAQCSVEFFVREGLQQLKETLGENNVWLDLSSRKITVSGGEGAQHALDRLLTLSHGGEPSHGLSSVSQDTQTCPVCYQDASSPYQLGCGHAYCVACLHHFISSASDSDQLPLTCLGNEARCRVPIPIPAIQHFLPPASFNRLVEAAFDAYIAKHPEVFKHCKTPDCIQIYRAVQAGAAPRTIHCPSCFSAVCNGCHEDAHDGFSCVESRLRRDLAEQERLNDAWIASQGGRVKKCPQCGVSIEKLEGCNHMTCWCGVHICWRCMGIFPTDAIYPHMNTAHGAIHGDGPHVREPLRREPPRRGPLRREPLRREPPRVGIGIRVRMGERREEFRRLADPLPPQYCVIEEGGGMLERMTRWLPQRRMVYRGMREQRQDGFGRCVIM